MKLRRAKRLFILAVHLTFVSGCAGGHYSAIIETPEPNRAERYSMSFDPGVVIDDQTKVMQPFERDARYRSNLEAFLAKDPKTASCKVVSDIKYFETMSPRGAWISCPRTIPFEASKTSFYAGGNPVYIYFLKVSQ